MSITINTGRAAAKRRARSRRGVTVNSFCPTGQGGGVDPSCSPGGNHPALPVPKNAETGVPVEFESYHASRGGELHATIEQGGLFTSPTVLHEYGLKLGSDKPGSVFKVDVRLENPVVVDDKREANRKLGLIAGKKYAEKEERGEITPEEYTEWDRLIAQKAWMRGHDGIVYKNTEEGPEYVIFEKKSITKQRLVSNTLTTNASIRVVINAGRSSAKRKATKRAGGGNGGAGLKTTRLDPTRTVMMRKALTAEMRRRFARLKALVVKLVVDEDAFGADRAKQITTNAGKWYGQPDREKVKLFAEWLKKQMGKVVADKTARDILRKYALEGMKKGAGRAFDDVRKSERTLSDGNKEKMDFYQGSRDQFLRESFRQPVAVQRVEALAGRSFDDLENITTDMSARMGRTLLDGLVQGKGARELTADLADDLDIGRTRSEIIARTEIIRAHAEGQLQAMEEMGVEEVGVQVEWSTANDDRVCPLCEDMEGAVFSIEEARGMIPRHPQCRCSWIPAGSILGDRTENRRHYVINRQHVECAHNQEMTLGELLDNVFCPTGEGGGVDPSCSPNTSINQKIENHYDTIILEKSDKEEPIVGDTESGKKLKNHLEEIARQYGVEVRYKTLKGKYGEHKSVGDNIIITIDKSSSPDMQAHSLAHEVSHLVMGHYKESFGPFQEHQAESAAHVISKIFGVDSIKFSAPRINKLPLAGTEILSHESIRQPVLAAIAKIIQPMGKPHNKTVQNQAWNIFCPTGEGGGVDPTCSPSGSGVGTSAEQAVMALAKQLEKIPHGGGKLGEKIKENYEKLPLGIKQHVAMGVKVAFTGWTASQALAEQIAKEQGLSDDDAANLRATLAATDIAAFKPAAVGLALAGPVASALSWVVPPVTGAYLLTSAATSPVKTYKAAHKLVKKWLDDHTDVMNAFCATGEGGGVDPTCGRGGKDGPPIDKGKRVPNPIPRTPHDLENEIENALEAFAKPDTVKEFIEYSASEERVPIDQLTSPQNVNRPEIVQYFKDNPDEIEEGKLPLVIQYGKHMFLRDGNSRTTAAMSKELGRTHIKARVVFVPEKQA